jgi:hypothetical protein
MSSGLLLPKAPRHPAMTSGIGTRGAYALCERRTVNAHRGTKLCGGGKSLVDYLLVEL